MTSRADMVGSGPSSGLYKPSPTPTEESSMPVYINDELLTVGGIINGILEGGAFPPQGKLPVRWREGMMMYFIEPLDDVYIKGQYKGQKVITSAGVWLYRRERWWKVIDDPSSIAGVVFAYRLTTDDTQPSTPSPSSAPPSGWSSVAPVKNDKTEYIWITMSSAYDESTDTHTWSQPTIFSAGVIDGVDGQDGADGADGAPGEPGLDGTNGENGYRGTVVLTDTVARTSWSNTAAYNLVVSIVSGDVDAKNRVPLQGDVVTQQSSAAGFVETRRYVGGSGNPGTWQVVELVVDGNAVVTGTLNGNALIANTQIRIGGNSGQDVVILDANNSNARIWVGNTTANSANFRVDPSGNLYANSGYFGGNIEADGVVGDVYKTYAVTPKVVTGATSGAQTIIDVNIPRHPTRYTNISISGIDYRLATSPARLALSWTFGGASGDTFLMPMNNSGTTYNMASPNILVQDAVAPGTGTINLVVSANFISAASTSFTEGKPCMIHVFWEPEDTLINNA